MIALLRSHMFKIDEMAKCADCSSELYLVRNNQGYYFQCKGHVIFGYSLAYCSALSRFTWA